MASMIAPAVSNRSLRKALQARVRFGDMVLVSCLGTGVLVGMLPDAVSKGDLASLAIPFCVSSASVFFGLMAFGWFRSR